MSTHFYHAVTKKAIIAFASLFNDIHIVRYNLDGTEKERIKVPLVYMTRQKFLTRIESVPNLENQIQYNVPAMSFEFSSFIYDPARKTNVFQKTIQKNDSNDYYMRYGRTPYNVTFMLNILTKNTEDSLQIIEQILPWFSPEYSVTVKMINPTDMSVDIPFVIQNVSYDENVEGSSMEDDFKFVNSQIEFTAKVYYYGPLTNLPLAATGPTSSFPNQSVEVPKGMIGKMITSFGDFDSGMTFENITVGVTGNSTPYNFDPCVTGNENQYYMTLSKYY